MSSRLTGHWDQAPGPEREPNLCYQLAMHNARYSKVDQPGHKRYHHLLQLEGLRFPEPLLRERGWLS
jgi:hypothetical protein